MELISSRSLVVQEPISLFSRGSVGSDVRQNRSRVERTSDTERASPCSPRSRGFDAVAGAVHPRAPARKSGRSIHHDNPIARHDPRERGARSPLAAAEAGSDGFHVTPPWLLRVPHADSSLRTRRVLRCGAKINFQPLSHSSMTESGWISIFAPVSFAARRAFWPSLPMASDNW